MLILNIGVLKVTLIVKVEYCKMKEATQKYWSTHTHTHTHTHPHTHPHTPTHTHTHTCMHAWTQQTISAGPSTTNPTPFSENPLPPASRKRKVSHQIWLQTIPNLSNGHRLPSCSVLLKSFEHCATYRTTPT